MHAHEGPKVPFTMGLLISFLKLLDARSILDVGTATGRGLAELQSALPGTFICGVEPIAALLQAGIASGRLKNLSVLQGSGTSLPFADQSVDVVCEFSTLHHVPQPEAMVREMLRVARKAVVIVDCNRFGQGSLLNRLAKLLLWKTGLWSAYDYLRTRGKRYQVSEGDGVFYSYSVYDNLAQISRWADRLFILPTNRGGNSSWIHPLLTAPGVLLIATKKSPAAAS